MGGIKTAEAAVYNAVVKPVTQTAITADTWVNNNIVQPTYSWMHTQATQAYSNVKAFVASVPAHIQQAQQQAQAWTQQLMAKVYQQNCTVTERIGSGGVTKTGAQASPYVLPVSMAGKTNNSPSISNIALPPGSVPPPQTTTPQSAPSKNIQATMRRNRMKNVLNTANSMEQFFGEIWNLDLANKDISKVLDAKYFSAYDGVPVIKVAGFNDRSFSLGALFISPNEDIANGGDQTVLHERGHVDQLLEIGLFKYIGYIAIPSMTSKVSGPDYYKQEWEITADLYGGVTRAIPHTEQEKQAGWDYLNWVKTTALEDSFKSAQEKALHAIPGKD